MKIAMLKSKNERVNIAKEKKIYWEEYLKSLRLVKKY